MMQVRSQTPAILDAYVEPTFPTPTLTIQIHSQVADDLNWLSQFRARHEKADWEARTRESDPAAKELWQQYQTYMTITYK
jgi:hypothetical protein